MRPGLQAVLRAKPGSRLRRSSVSWQAEQRRGSISPLQHNAQALKYLQSPPCCSRRGSCCLLRYPQPQLLTPAQTLAAVLPPPHPCLLGALPLLPARAGAADFSAAPPYCRHQPPAGPPQRPSSRLLATYGEAAAAACRHRQPSLASCKVEASSRAILPPLALRMVSGPGTAGARRTRHAEARCCRRCGQPRKARGGSPPCTMVSLELHTSCNPRRRPRERVRQPKRSQLKCLQFARLRISVINA